MITFKELTPGELYYFTRQDALFTNNDQLFLFFENDYLIFIGEKKTYNDGIIYKFISKLGVVYDKKKYMIWTLKSLSRSKNAK